MNLRDWFNSRFRNKILAASVIALALQLIFISIFAFNQSKQFKKDLSNVGDTISIGISQKNHELVVSTLTSAAERWDVSKLELCYDGKPLFSLPTLNEDCLRGPRGSGAFHDEFQIRGFQSARLIVERIPIQAHLLILILITSSILVYIAIAGQFRSLSTKMWDDLFEPLANRLVTNEPLEIAELEELRTSILNWKENETTVAQAHATATLASQVAHDIRSPLSAINVAISNMGNVDPDRVSLLQKAVKRINDIANDLLISGQSASESGSEQVDLAEMVRDIYEEKRALLQSDELVQISLDLQPNNSAKCEAIKKEILRAISNVTNNAIESLDGRGHVTLAVRSNAATASVIILDDGKRIPDSLIDKLGNERVTLGKEGTSSGSGLGLLHAKRTVEAMRGRLLIQSRLGSGTMITMTFPRVSDV